MNQMLVLGPRLSVRNQCFDVLGDSYPYVALGFLNRPARSKTPRKSRTVCIVTCIFRLFFNQDFKTVVVHTISLCCVQTKSNRCCHGEDRTARLLMENQYFYTINHEQKKGDCAPRNPRKTSKRKNRGQSDPILNGLNVFALKAFERLDIVGAFKSGRIGHVLLAHRALHLRHRLVLIHLHPRLQTITQGSQVIHTVLEQR